MTAATRSENNKKTSFFSVRIKSKLAEDSKLFVTNMVFQLLCLPLLAGITLVYYSAKYSQERPFAFEPFYFIAAIAFILSIAMGIVIPMINFRYLYNKSLVDMNYSLPLNNRQRFFADYLSGLAVYIVPFIIGMVIAIIEILIGSCFIDLREILMNFAAAIRVLSVILTGMIMLYSFSVFAINFAGSIFEALFSIAAVNIMVPACIAITWMNIVNGARYGLQTSSLSSSYTLFTTSPIGVFYFIISYLEKNPLSSHTDTLVEAKYPEDLLISMYLHFMVRTLLFIALIVLVTFLLYRRRKAEDVSKPYVYSAFYYIIMSLAIYCIFSLMGITKLSSASAAALIISGIIWFVMEVIRRRGFKRFWTAVISFSAACAVVFGIITVINVTHGLGMAKAVPSASSVTDIEISIWGYSHAQIGPNKLYADRNVINDAVKLNKELVDRHFMPDKYEYELSEIHIPVSDYDAEKISQYNLYYDEQTIELTFYLKNGSSCIRQYTVPTTMLTELCCDIFTSAEYAKHTANSIFRQSLRTNADVDPLYAYKNGNRDLYCEFNLTDKLDNTEKITTSLNEGKELTEAIRSDIAAMKPEDMKNAEFICRVNDQNIYNSYENTVRFFEDHDIDFRKTSEKLITEITTYTDVSFYVDPEYVFPLLFFRDVNYEGMYGYRYLPYDRDDCSHDLIKIDRIFRIDFNHDRGYVDYSKNWELIIDDAGAFEKLLDIATPVVINEKVIAEFQIKGATLYVTDREGNRDIVEKAKKSFNIYNKQTGEPMPADMRI